MCVAACVQVAEADSAELCSAFTEAEGGPLLPDAFRLASAFPRRVFERPADGGGALHEAMEAAGLGGGQVALSLEA